MIEGSARNRTPLGAPLGMVHSRLGTPALPPLMEEPLDGVPPPPTSLAQLREENRSPEINVKVKGQAEVQNVAL